MIVLLEWVQGWVYNSSLWFCLIYWLLVVYWCVILWWFCFDDWCVSRFGWFWLLFLFVYAICCGFRLFVWDFVGLDVLGWFVYRGLWCLLLLFSLTMVALCCALWFAFWVCWFVSLVVWVYVFVWLDCLFLLYCFVCLKLGLMRVDCLLVLVLSIVFGCFVWGLCLIWFCFVFCLVVLVGVKCVIEVTLLVCFLVFIWCLVLCCFICWLLGVWVMFDVCLLYLCLFYIVSC